MTAPKKVLEFLTLSDNEIRARLRVASIEAEGDQKRLEEVGRIPTNAWKQEVTI